MKAQITAVQYMGMLMRKDTFNIDYMLELIEIINNSYLSAKDVVTILQQIFKKEKSCKILIGTQILEYCVKNGNRNFHQAANKETFQKSVLGLLKRQRGKMNILKQLRSNTENWSQIQSRILYLVQLCYDAFILEESKYPHVINTYKILRKENVIFPPRNINQRSLLAVQTQSPIFDNIESIAEADKDKFKKRLRAMGLTKLSEKFQEKQKMVRIPETIKKQKQMTIDDISEKIAIIQSQDYEPSKVIRIIEEVKTAIEQAKIKPNQQKYWKEIKQAAEIMIAEWEQKNSLFILSQQQKYLQFKMSGHKIESPTKEKPKQQNQNSGNKVWDLLGDLEEQKVEPQDQWGDFAQTTKPEQKVQIVKHQLNLIDLL